MREGEVGAGELGAGEVGACEGRAGTLGPWLDQAAVDRLPGRVVDEQRGIVELAGDASVVVCVKVAEVADRMRELLGAVSDHISRLHIARLAEGHDHRVLRVVMTKQSEGSVGGIGYKA